MESTTYAVYKRFMRFVPSCPGAACWEWNVDSAHHKYGYDMFEIKLDGKWKSKQAHRIAWLIFRGAIPDGLSVLHTCDNPPCVNPDHLYLGTHQDNMKDRATRKTHPLSKRTHCNQGHSFSGNNLYIGLEGRRCRRCRTLYEGLRMARLRKLL